jgi:hypothetical protein
LESAPFKVEVIELGAGHWVTDHLKHTAGLMQFWQEPVFTLNETVTIHDPTMFEMAAAEPGPMTLSPGYLSFMGKFTPQQVANIQWPEVKTKKDDVLLGEGRLLRDTLAPGVPVLCPDFVDPNPHDPANFEFKHGRNNLVLKNEYLTKYKGHWDIDRIK